MGLNVRRQEYSHHTLEQVTGYVTDALGVVAQLGLEGPLADALVLKVVDLLAAKQIVMEQVAPAAPVDLRQLRH